jgi:hypothetical protein
MLLSKPAPERPSLKDRPIENIDIIPTIIEIGKCISCPTIIEIGKCISCHYGNFVTLPALVLLHNGESIAGASGEAVNPRHRHYVAGDEGLKRFGNARAGRPAPQ